MILGRLWYLTGELSFTVSPNRRLGDLASCLEDGLLRGLSTKI